MKNSNLPLQRTQKAALLILPLEKQLKMTILDCELYQSTLRCIANICGLEDTALENF
jgi:hypothetical protein